MEEIFKNVTDFEHLYEVSNFGRIRSKKTGMYRKFQLDHSGYQCFKVSRKPLPPIRKYVHRLVALAFLSNPENKTQVNHIDGNKINNYLSNLEWSTPKENTQHYLRCIKSK